MEQTIVMPNSMTIDLVPESERKKRASNFGNSNEPSSTPVVVSLPVRIFLVVYFNGATHIGKWE